MGMSASQARYISLTARMSDVEYECQQINQQRLTLSNKMNEVQEQLYNMDVPTPPSKQDFLYDVYTGKDRAGKTVTVNPKADGTFDIIQQKHGFIIQKGDKLDVTEGASAKMASRTVGDVGWDPGDLGRNFTVTVPNLKPETKVCKDETVLAALAGKELNGKSTQAGNWKLPDGVSASSITFDTKYYFNDKGQRSTTKEVEDGTNPDGTPHYKTVTADSSNHDEVEYTGFSCSIELHTGYLVEDPNDTISVTVLADGNLSPASYQENGSIPNGYQIKGGVADIASQKCKTEGGKDSTIAEMRKLAPTAISDQGLSGILGGFYSKDENGTTLTVDDVVVDKDTYQPKKDTVIWYPQSSNKSAGDQTVNGRTVLTMQEAIDKYGNDASTDFGNAKSALEHSYGTNYDEWRVIVETSGDKTTFSFCKAADLNGDNKKVQVYNVAQGDFDDDPINVSTDDISFDEKGHPEQVVLADGTIVKLTYGQEVDEIAYDAAMNEYNIEKAEYDQEQNELNKKTSIYQRQDKQLELKLTRLDTERNALNTELEAVKKVIQDAVDKGFKTFSG